jgi:hypothetical protein
MTNVACRSGFLRVSLSSELGSKGRATGNCFEFIPTRWCTLAKYMDVLFLFSWVTRLFGGVCFNSLSASLFDVLAAVNTEDTVFWAGT